MRFFKRKTKTRNGETIYEGDKLCFINSDGEHCTGRLTYSKKYKKLYFYNVLYNPKDYYSLKKCTCETTHNSSYTATVDKQPTPKVTS
jgi:hypothetical protein